MYPGRFGVEEEVVVVVVVVVRYVRRRLYMRSSPIRLLLYLVSGSVTVESNRRDAF